MFFNLCCPRIKAKERVRRMEKASVVGAVMEAGVMEEVGLKAPRPPGPTPVAPSPADILSGISN